MSLAGDDLPIAVTLQPRVSDVVTRFQILAEDRLGFVSVITQYGGAADNPALGVRDLDRSGITCRQRSDVGEQFWLVENASFFVGENAIVSEVFFPWSLVAGNDGIVKLLSATDEFVVGNRRIRGEGEAYGGQKSNEREFHNKG